MLIHRGERDVVRLVRDKFVTESFVDLASANQKNAGHAFDVTIRRADEISVRPGAEHASHAARVQILAPFGANEAEGFV